MIILLCRYVWTIYHQLKKLQHVTNNKRNISDELTLLVLFGFPDNKSGAPKRWIFRRGREACLHLPASYSIYWAVGGCFKIRTSKHVSGWDVNVSLHPASAPSLRHGAAFCRCRTWLQGTSREGQTPLSKATQACHAVCTCLQARSITKPHVMCHSVSLFCCSKLKHIFPSYFGEKGFLSGVGVPVVVWWWKACRIAKKNALPEQAWSQNPMYLLSHLLFISTFCRKSVTIVGTWK